MPGFLKGRLRLMMFLQFFIWGSWYATAGNFMKNNGMTELIYLAYVVSPIGSIVAPFFMGLLADRFFAVQKVMGVMHILSGLFVFCAPFVVASPPLFLAFLLFHMLCYMPTLGLATATAFHLLNDREKEFPLVRVFGTIGWIAAGILVSRVLQGDTTGIPMRVAGTAGILMGLYSFTLPNIPPQSAIKKVSFRDILGVNAIRQLNSRPFIVFMISVLLTSIPLATYFSYVPVFLKAANVSEPAFKMTFGNMSEAIFLLLLPWFFRKLGVKWVLIIGMTAWVLRYTLFALAAPDAVLWMMMTGILLHGLCYDFVYVAGQIYTDQVAPVSIRAQAQGLFVLVSYGIGHGLGALAAGWAFNRIVTGEGSQVLHQWQTFWTVPIIFATVVTIAFVLGSRSKPALTASEAPAPIS
ncbi:MFS transporter [Spirosoma knui]